MERTKILHPLREGARVRVTVGRQSGRLGTVTEIVDMEPGRSWRVKLDGNSYSSPGYGPESLQVVS